MKGTRLAVLVGIMICAFALGGFVQSAGAATQQTPAKVVVTPKNPSVVIGKTENFTATVYDKKGSKIKTTVPLTWSLSQGAQAGGCSIDQNGVVTVASTASPETFKKGVIAAVTATPTVSGAATFTVVDAPFKGGVFVGTEECTAGSCNGEFSDLAITAGAATFEGLSISATQVDYSQFSGVISKKGKVSGVFSGGKGSTVTVTGNLEYTSGAVSGMKGTWTSSKKGNSGTWSVSLVTGAASGGKVGSWTIPAVSGASALTGRIAAIFKDNGTISAVAVEKTNGQLTNNELISGTWNSSTDAVTFPSFAEGNGAANACTNASGTYTAASKEATGQLLNASSDAVGSWVLGNLK